MGSGDPPTFFPQSLDQIFVDLASAEGMELVLMWSAVKRHLVR